MNLAHRINNRKDSSQILNFIFHNAFQPHPPADIDLSLSSTASILHVSIKSFYKTNLIRTHMLPTISVLIVIDSEEMSEKRILCCTHIATRVGDVNFSINKICILPQISNKFLSDLHITGIV